VQPAEGAHLGALCFVGVRHQNCNSQLTDQLHQFAFEDHV